MEATEQMLSAAPSKKIALSKAVHPLVIKTILTCKLRLSIQMYPKLIFLNKGTKRTELCSEITCGLQINENEVAQYSADLRKTALT